MVLGLLHHAYVFQLVTDTTALGVVRVLLMALAVGWAALFLDAWRIGQPLLASPPPVETYEPGSWGPADAAKLTSHYGGWRGPWKAE